MIGKVNYDSYYFDELAKLVYDDSPSMRDKSSPNNIRRVIIGASAIAVDRFVGGCKVFNVSPEKRDRCLTSPTCKPVLSAIAGLGNSRVCSNIEEIIFCDGILQKFDLFPINSLFSSEALPLKSLILKRTSNGVSFNTDEGNKFKRLRFVCSVSAPVDAVKVVLSNAQEGSNRYDYIVGADNTALSKLGVITKSDMYNVRWYTHHSLRKDTYSLDSPGTRLSTYFDSADRFLVDKERIEAKNKALAQSKDKQSRELSLAVSVFSNTYKCCKYLVDLVGNTCIGSALADGNMLNDLRDILLSVKNRGVPDSSLLGKSFREKCNKWGIPLIKEDKTQSTEVSIKSQVACLSALSSLISSALLTTVRSLRECISLKYPITYKSMLPYISKLGKLSPDALHATSLMNETEIENYYSSLCLLLAMLSTLCLSANKRGDDELPIISSGEGSKVIRINVSKLRTKEYWKELIK